MKSYMLKEGAAYAIVPGVGRVVPGMVITGNLDTLVPGTLREVEAPAPPPEFPAPPPVQETATPPRPIAPQPVVPESQVSVVLSTGDVATADSESEDVEPDEASAPEAPPASAPAPPVKTVDLPAPDTSVKTTTSGSVAGPSPPKGSKKNR